MSPPGSVDRRRPPRPATAAAGVDRVARARRRLEAALEGTGVRARRATPADLDRVASFDVEIFGSQAPAEVGGYDLYRLLRFGLVAVLEDDTGRIRGSLLEEGWLDAARTSFIVSVAVAPELGGRAVGTALLGWVGELARARGAGRQRALVAPENLASLVTFLDRGGFIAVAIHRKIPGLEGPRLELERSLERTAAPPDDPVGVPAVKSAAKGDHRRTTRLGDLQALESLLADREWCGVAVETGGASGGRLVSIRRVRSEGVE